MPDFLKTKIFRWILSAVITVIAAWIIFSQTSFESLAQVLQEIKWEWFLVALGIYFVSTLVRAQRFVALGISGIPWLKLINISFIHYFFSNLLPFRSGELSFVYLINKDRAATLPVNLSALLLARVFDFLAVILWLIVSVTILFPAKLASGDPIVLAAFGILLLIIGFLFVLLFSRRLVSKVVLFFLKLLPSRFASWQEKFSSRWQEIGQALDIIRKRKILFQVLGYSLLGWLFLYLGTQALLAALQTSVNFWQSVFITSFPPIASLIPLGTLGNFGTVEAGWTFGLSLIGVALEVAIALSLAIHFLTILMQSLTTVQALVWRRFGY